MNRILFLLFIVASPLCASAQTHTLTFTSTSDAKFFVYVNGVLHNEKSSGMVSISGLEEKDYHVRVVIDDPFEIAVTRTIKPSEKHNSYTVQFNAVRERVYIKEAQNVEPCRAQEEWTDNEEQKVASNSSASPKVRKKTSIMQGNSSDTTRQQLINHIKIQTIE